MSNQWIDWNGGECPVGSLMKVEVKYRKEITDDDANNSCEAGDFNWDNDDSPWDIVAYRLSEPAQVSSPKVVDTDGWMYHDGKGCPVDGDVRVNVQFYVSEDEVEFEENNYPAEGWGWNWSNSEPGYYDIVKWRYAKEQPQQEVVQETEEEEKKQHTHYFKDVSHLDSIDVYRTLELFNVTSPCLQHAIKKLLCAGIRGAKDVEKDVAEAIDSLERWKAMQIEDGDWGK